MATKAKPSKQAKKSRKPSKAGERHRKAARVDAREALGVPSRHSEQGQSKRMSGLTAAARVLVAAKKPMRCADIVKQMLAKGWWSTNGRTPDATLYSAIIREIGLKGTASRFKKVDRGLFTATNLA